jgi:antitoxin component of MazEF toxin-antitoxin module
MVLRTVYKAGNGLVFSIPPKFAAALHLTAGSQVAVRVQNRALVVASAVTVPADVLAARESLEESSHE